MAQGIILAGGYSSRAHRNKMTLKFDGVFVIEKAIDSMMPFVEKVFVITGFYHDEIGNLLKNKERVNVIKNEHYDKGMFSSVQVGASHVDDDCFILPGDCPLVSPETYKNLLNGKGNIRVPSYYGKIGHPIFISKKTMAELRAFSPSSNLKIFRDAHDYEIINTSDKYILLDIDTIEDYQNLINSLRKD